MNFYRRAALALLALSAASPALACDLTSITNTRWTVKRENATSILATPCGDNFFAMGVNVLDAGNGGPRDRPHYDWHDHAPTLEAWVDATKQRLAEWGFNSAGAWSLTPDQLKLPTVINLELGRLAKFHWYDPFDPAAEARMMDLAKTLTAPYRDSPYRIGYFSDNEVGWWDGAMFVFYSQQAATSFTKQRLLALLRQTYRNDWRAFTRDFVPPEGIASWNALSAAQKPTKLRVGGHGIRIVRQWGGIVAARYYQVARAAIKAADPQALYFGDRLPIYYDSGAIRAERDQVDALAVNYNVDSPEGWIAPYFFDGLRRLSGDKPLLISEWFFAARENRTGNRNNGHLMTVDTQAERASGAAAAARNFAAIPEAVGLDWFQYYDYPVGGRQDSEDYNFGLVDIADRPYEDVVAALSATNRALPAIHAQSTIPPAMSRSGITIPKATIDWTKESLADWPKPRSLLPPMIPSKGEVAFGEAYLSWSDQGLQLASIGQDYYDLDLLSYDGAFPLSESYRVELDVDAGAGPKRFTLYFIPPKGKTRDYPPMEPKLCAGSLDHNDCAAVPGSKVAYFGADQPRIVAEAMIPWAALGLSGPPLGGKLKVEVASTAWHNSRWMSLSGQAPGTIGPQRWSKIRLANQ